MPSRYAEALLASCAFLPVDCAFLLDTLTKARRATLVGASAAPILSTTSSAVGCRRALRSSSVVGRQPARRHVDATEVATEGT
jgi:hypothetical protein